MAAKGRHIEEAQKAWTALLDNIQKLVKGLHWKDFELLADHIFRQAGWKRIGELGKTQKSIDIVLIRL